MAQAAAPILNSTHFGDKSMLRTPLCDLFGIIADENCSGRVMLSSATRDLGALYLSPGCLGTI